MSGVLDIGGSVWYEGGIGWFRMQRARPGYLYEEPRCG